MKNFTFFVFLFFIILIIKNEVLSQSSYWRRLLPVPTFDVAVNPFNYNSIYVGGEGGNFYRSFDGGNTWDTVKFFWAMNTARMNNVIILPNDTNVIIVGGLNFCNIAKTTDRGDNWSVVLTSNYCIDLNGKAMIYKPDEPNIIYAADFKWGRMYRSTNSGDTWEIISVITEPTTIYDENGNPKDTMFPIKNCAMEIRKDSSNILLVGSISGKIFLSKDGGYDWQFADFLQKPDSIQDDCEITRIEFSDRDPRTGYAVITYLFSANKNNGGLHKTTDGGYTWERLAFQDTSIWALAVKGRGNHDEILIGGYTEDFWTIDTNVVPGVGIVRLSTNGGLSWINYDKQMDWVIQDPRQNGEILSLFVVDTNTIWGVGDKGNICMTEYPQFYWSNVYFPELIRFNGLYFFDKKNGFICGENGSLFKTTSQGGDWTKVNISTTKNLYSIIFPQNQDTGIIVGESGTIFLSVDRGKIWINKSLDLGNDLLGVKQIGSDTLLVWGTGGVLLLSTNKGRDWHRKDININEDIIGVAVLPNGRLFIATRDSKLYTSNVNFEPAVLVLRDPDISFSGIDFANLSLGILTGKSGYYYRTIDGGETWTKIKYFSQSRYFNGIKFINKQKALIFGQFGVVAISMDSGLNWNMIYGGSGPRGNSWRAYYFGEEGKEKLFLATEAGLFVLEYPLSVYDFDNAFFNNPILLRVLSDNQTILFTFQLPNQNSDNVRISLFNSVGSVLISKTMQVGSGEIQDQLSLPFKLSSGIYFLQIINGGKQFVRSIIIY
ncbi:MAG: YCF48-related protein [Candidatus Kapaibacteriales bacterium]